MSERPAACDGCPFAWTARGYADVPAPRPEHRLLALTTCPQPDGTLFDRPAAMKLAVAERMAGMQVDFDGFPEGGTVLHAPLIRCWQDVPSAPMSDECRRRHAGWWEAAAALPRLVLGDATEVACGVRYAPKTVGTMLPATSGWVTVGPHPKELALGGGGAQEHLLPLLVAAIDKSLRVRGPGVPRIRVVDAEFVAVALEQSPPQHHGLVAIDMESYDGKPTLVGFSWQPGQAWVCWWNESVRALVERVFADPALLPVFHNAAFDVLELEEAGVPAPRVWVDTMNLAAVVDAALPLGLQSQVCAWVDGAVAWKGLVNHRNPHGTASNPVQTLWGRVLREVGQSVPNTPSRWYSFYNGLDVAWTLDLALRLRDLAGADGREYYRSMIQPLQEPLLRMGAAGLPVDLGIVEGYRDRYLAEEKAATETVREFGERWARAELAALEQAIHALECKRDEEVAARKFQGLKRAAFSRAAELTKLRTKASTLRVEGFNPSSQTQRARLLGWMGMPLKKGKKTNGVSVDEATLSSLVTRLEMGRIKPRNVTAEMAANVLRAMVAQRSFAGMRTTFLEPLLELEREEVK